MVVTFNEVLTIIKEDKLKEELKKLYHLTAIKAAKHIAEEVSKKGDGRKRTCSEHVFKRLYQAAGIEHWPYRRFCSINDRIDKLNKLLVHPKAKDSYIQKYLLTYHTLYTNALSSLLQNANQTLETLVSSSQLKQVEHIYNSQDNLSTSFLKKLDLFIQIDNEESLKEQTALDEETAAILLLSLQKGPSVLRKRGSLESERGNEKNLSSFISPSKKQMIEENTEEVAAADLSIATKPQAPGSVLIPISFFQNSQATRLSAKLAKTPTPMQGGSVLTPFHLVTGNSKITIKVNKKSSTSTFGSS